jgi:beta-N-acetylhexosaminidase
MTLERKVGQLFVTYAYGDRAVAPDPVDVAANRAAHGVDDAATLVRRYHLGGVIYFRWSRNLADPAQIAALSNGLQRSATIPLLVGTDQEHGSVTRIGAPATVLPGNMALGAGPQAEADTRAAADIAGRELRAMGVNQTYAPDADVNTEPANPVIGVRSFGSDPESVARLTRAAVAGYQDAGVAATAKHFPGHGDTEVDSHTGLPVIGRSLDEWRRLDLPPFRAAVDAGVDSIMTAHIVVPALDPSGDPATLSRPIITGLLRGELGYDGVVVTDSLLMAGVRHRYADDRVPVLALAAGVDQLLMPPDLDLAYHAVLAAVRDGELTEARIDASVLRILRLKEVRGLLADPYVDEPPAGVGVPEHLATAQAIADRTVTLIRNDDALLPLVGVERRILVTGWGVRTTAALAAALSRRGHRVDAAVAAPTAEQVGAADLVVVTTNGLRADPAQRRLVAELGESGPPVVVVAVGEPYDAGHVTAPACLVSYGHTAPSLEAVARVLLGEVAPVGRLPVPVPSADDPRVGACPAGWGLTYP